MKEMKETKETDAMKKQQYIQPTVKVVSFKVERGYTGSGFGVITTTYSDDEIASAPDYGDAGFFPTGITTDYTGWDD